MTETETALNALAKRRNGPKAAPEIEPPAQLPPDRAKAVEYGIAQFQHLLHERDTLNSEVSGLKERIAALEIEAEGLRSQVTEAHSQITTAHLVRDQALADRIKYEALFISVQAQLRAFAVPAAPLIQNADIDSIEEQ